MRRADEDVSRVVGHGYMDFGLLNSSPFVAEPCEDTPVDGKPSMSKGPHKHSKSHVPVPHKMHEPVSRQPHLLTFGKWAANLVPMVLRSRTPFSAFLSHSIQLSKALNDDLAPTFFPVPIPPGYCHVMPANPSASRRRQCHLSRVLHTTIMALNFWYSGGKFIDSSALQRAPNRLHRVLFRRIRSLLKSDGPALAFETTKAGRRFPELVARLSELSEVMTYNGVSGDPYCKTFGGVDVVKDDSVMPELQPYRDLDPSRLLLYGSGHFDATDFLDDPLVLPYRDPSILSVNVLPGPRPSMRESPKTLGQLASVWDKQGLLMIHKEAIDPNKYVRIFNAYKSECQDRQIGDRRGANFLESRISSFGPSSQLPAGCDLGELCIDPKKQSLAISITDRKDFYHQFWCSRQKTLGNSLGPPIHEDFVKTCGAYGDYLQRYAKKRYDRSREGDRLDCRHPALLSNQLCHIAFRSVLQGDHCGVDIATCAP